MENKESLFNNKDKNKHPSHIVYHGTCNCGSDYDDETSRNLEERISEHEDTTRLSELARRLALNPSHFFSWKTIAPALSWTICRIIESLIIAKFRPNLNQQVQAFSLSLFPTGIT